MTLDQWITLFVARPAQRLRFWPESFRVPILMYHSISNDEEKDRHPYYKVCTRPALFRDHLQVLREEGFRVVSLSEALLALQSTELASTARPAHRGERLAVITFDDGFRDFLTAAWPVLAEFQYPATVFLATQFIGQQRRSFKGRECLTWDEVRELRRQGVHFGSHTISHPQLVDLAEVDFNNELRNSRQIIEHELGESIDTFAHPYAFPSVDTAYIRRFRDTLEACGYRLAVTTSLGCSHSGDDPFSLRRLPANSSDNRRLFLAKVHGSYDWLAIPQKAAKSFKGLLAEFNGKESFRSPREAPSRQSSSQ